jgi:hypothetical protein
VVLAIVATACTTAGKPTPIIIYTTATPRPTAPPTPVPTPTPIPTPTPVPTDTPVPGSPTPVPTAKPTGTPGPSPTGVAACSGTATQQAFFADAANKLPFGVYCGVLPGGWYFTAGNYTQPSGGIFNVTYKGPGGAQIVIQEGAFCTGGAVTCSPHDAALGSAKFGGMAGTLVSVGSGFAIYVAPGTAAAYTAKGTGISQATFVSITAGLVKVPKS